MNFKKADNWDKSLQKKKYSTGLEADSFIFKKILRGLKVKIKKRTYVDFKYKTLDYRIHLEHVYDLIDGVNIWMVNQELVTREDLEDLEYVDLVLVKTKYAEKLIREYKRKNNSNFKVFNLGFTTISKPCSKTMKVDYDKWLHVAGASWMKNTVPILRLWKRHPEYPHLTVLCRSRCYWDHEDLVDDCNKLKNVTIYTEHIPFSDLVELQCTSGVQIVSSETEGWGHYIREAMLNNVSTIYTDFPPMNEIATPNVTGIPIKNGRKRKTFYLPGAYGLKIYQRDIKKAVEKMISLPLKKREKMGIAGRNLVIQERMRFLKQGEKFKKEVIPEIYEELR